MKTALRVFELVATSGEAGVSELARAMGVPKTTVQRGLVTLHEAGWLRPAGTGARRRWVPTTKLLLFSRGLDPSLGNLRTLSREVMERLGAETRESIHLVVREDDEIVLVERIDSTHALRTVRPLGGRARLHIVSTGKAILAKLPPADLDRYLDSGLEQATDRSIVDPIRLREEIARVGARGFGVSDGELELGIRAVGAAICNPQGKSIAALSISCPAVRLPDDLVDRYGALVTAAVAEIEARLGNVESEASASGQKRIRAETP